MGPPKIAIEVMLVVSYRLQDESEQEKNFTCP